MGLQQPRARSDRDAASAATVTEFLRQTASPRLLPQGHVKTGYVQSKPSPFMFGPIPRGTRVATMKLEMYACHEAYLPPRHAENAACAQDGPTGPGSPAPSSPDDPRLSASWVQRAPEPQGPAWVPVHQRGPSSLANAPLQSNRPCGSFFFPPSLKVTGPGAGALSGPLRRQRNRSRNRCSRPRSPIRRVGSAPRWPPD